jgi:hypothetical protein
MAIALFFITTFTRHTADVATVASATIDPSLLRGRRADRRSHWLIIEFFASFGAIYTCNRRGSAVYLIEWSFFDFFASQGSTGAVF